MKLRVLTMVAMCASGIALALSAAGPGSAPPLPANDCTYVQTSYTAYGYCFEWAEGCANCCRHEDQAMEVPICAGGNQFKYCTPYQLPFMAKVHYCPGTEPNLCQYAGTITCGHAANAEQSSGPCPSVP
jgi:hypothetical protein